MRPGVVLGLATALATTWTGASAQGPENRVGTDARRASAVRTVAGTAPTVDITPHNYASQDYGRCAQACFAMIYAHSTVPYFSMDTPRNVTLVYNQDRVDTKPFIHVNVAHGGGTPRPIKYMLKVKKASGGLIKFLNGDSVLAFDSIPGTFRIGGQLNAATNSIGATGLYGIDIRVVAQFSASASDTAGTTVSTWVTVVNENNSDYARGWGVAGVQRLYYQSNGFALITEGDGSAVVYQKVSITWTPPAGEFSALDSVASGWVRRYPDSTKVTFNTAGRMTEIRGRFNNTTTFSYYTGYESRVLLQYITDPVGKAIRLNYGAWALDSVIDPMGRAIRIDVDYATRRVNQIVDWDKVATNLRYDTKLRLDSIQDRRGYWTEWSYGSAPGDSSDRVTQVKAPTVTVYGDSSVQPTTTLTPWQKLGVPYASTSGTNATPVLVDSVRAVVTDPLGHSTRFTVTRWGQPAKVADALNRTTTIGYDASGLVRSVRLPSYPVLSPDTLRDTLAYTSSGLVSYLKPAATAATNVRYDGKWIADPDSIWGTDQPGIRRFVRADSGFVDSIRVGSAVGTTTRFTYDNKGRLVGAVDKLNHQLGKRTYAGVNENLSRDSLPGNRISTFTYDQYGRDSIARAPQLAPRVTLYDVMNRPTKTYDSAQIDTVKYAYDGLFLTQVTDPNGNLWKYVYNTLGWVDSIVDPASKRDFYQYDRDGNPRRWNPRRTGINLYFAYDSLHRRTTKTGDSTWADTLSYSTDGRVIRASSSVATDSTFLNVRGQPDSVVTKLAIGTYRLRYAYSAAGRLLDVTSPSLADHHFGYRPDRGTLDSIAFSGLTSTFTYDGDLRDTLTSFPSGQSITQVLTTIHDMAKIDASIGADSLVDRLVGTDALGRVNQHAAPTGPNAYRGHRYAYDPQGRLDLDTTFAVDTASACSTTQDWGTECPPGTAGFRMITIDDFSYDAAGNRTDGSGSYGTGNRIQGFGGCTYATNLDGTVASRSTCSPSLTFKWTAEGNFPTSVVAGGITYAFYADPAGRLVQIDSAGSVYRYFLWSGDQLYAEFNGAGTRLTQYSWYPGLDQLHQIADGGTIFDAVTDALGNVIALTTSTGVYRTYDYSPWAESGGTDTWGFSGKDRMRFKGAMYLPEVGLYNMRNRWYEPLSGRFLSEDPMGLAGGVNSYIFAGNDPIDGWDPSGLQSDCEYSRVGDLGIGAECDRPPPPPIPPPAWPDTPPDTPRDTRPGDPDDSQTGGVDQPPIGRGRSEASNCISRTIGENMTVTNRALFGPTLWGAARSVGSMIGGASAFARATNSASVAVSAAAYFQSSPRMFLGYAFGQLYPGVRGMAVVSGLGAANFVLTTAALEFGVILGSAIVAVASCS